MFASYENALVHLKKQLAKGETCYVNFKVPDSLKKAYPNTLIYKKRL